jgi:hypothetical protein
VELTDGSLVLKKKSIQAESEEGLPRLKNPEAIKINKVTGNITKSTASNIIEYHDTTSYVQHMQAHEKYKQ